MITQLLAENVKKLTAVQIDADGNPIILTGDNEAGKTTVLDCIWIALKGKIPAMPIRAGQTAGRIKLTIWLDEEEREITVERTFTTKASYITVRDESGKKIASPQKLLDSLISSLTLDPLEFSRMKPNDQRETLLRIAGVDLTKWDVDYKALYNARTVVKGTHKQLDAAHSQLPEPPADTPDREQSAADLIDEIEGMSKQRTEFDDAVKVRDALDRDIAANKYEIERLEEALRLERKSLENFESSREHFTLPKEPDPEAMAAARERLKHIEAVNANVRIKLNKETSSDALRKAKEQVDRAERAIAKKLEDKQQLLESADFGIPDLFVNDEGVLFEGKPLEQQSSARTIEISTRIAMRDKTKLKLLIIRDASLIGTVIFKRIAEMAEAEGYQMWVERFQEDPSEQGIHIVDGSVSHIAGKAVTPAPVEDDEVEVVEGL